MNQLTVADILGAPADATSRPVVMIVATTSPPWPGSDPDFVDRHPRFKQLNDYLRERAPKGELPGRQHIDPTDIPNLLSVISFVDVERDGRKIRLRYRLVGTTCTEAMGRDLTGEYLDESQVSQCGDLIVPQMKEIVARGQPGFGDLPVALPGREHIGYQRVYFPLARNGVDVDMLVGVHSFHFESRRRRGLF